LTISLRPIEADNVFAIIKLSDTLTEEQKRNVAPNVVSLAQAYVHLDIAWPRAIYEDEEPIGFVMLSLFDPDIPVEDRPAYMLWRFMVKLDRQGHGVGKQVLDLIVEKCKKDGVRTLYTSCVMERPEPYRFYVNYGFLDTGEDDDNERILKMRIV
jgi:diamine N-acetyltransferase